MTSELHWMSAIELADAIRSGVTTSVEALDHLVDRIRDLDGPINAVVRWDLDRARADATEADAAIARGADVGPLHGVPMTIKDSFSTEGCITTSGAPELAEHVPTEDAWPVARLREAGAIVFAKTNLPYFAGDVQSFNDVYGTTNNPHGVDRTPGGSSGGSAAALAMGFTPMELGSDIGGSIRVPCHYSGVMGLKTSYGIVPSHGQIPGMPGTLSLADIAVTGPMARTVDDLELALEILAGPDRWSTPAWRLDLPAPRTRRVGEVRLAAWIDDEYCPVDDDTRTSLAALCDGLRDAGAHVDDTARPSPSLGDMHDVFETLLFTALSGEHPRDKIEHLAADDSDSIAGNIRRRTASRHREWLAVNERRQQHRERWAEFFEGFDAILLPVHPRAAIPHDHTAPMTDRMITVDGAERPYMDLFRWIAPAGASYLPAAVVPIGTDGDGLPIGVQIVGPFLQDRTTLEIARHITTITGGCPRPALARQSVPDTD